jgi:hypothetical protein
LKAYGCLGFIVHIVDDCLLKSLKVFGQVSRITCSEVAKMFWSGLRSKHRKLILDPFCFIKVKPFGNVKEPHGESWKKTYR